MKIFSTYNTIARVFPTIIGLSPFFILQYLFLNNRWSINLVLVSVVGNISLSTVLIYTFNQYFIRIPSKIFEDVLFGNQLYFPTTEFLMYSNDEYSTQFKEQIRKAIKKDFSIQLPTRINENFDEVSSRKRIKDAVKLMIAKVKDGHLVLQHNIEYGFVRNLWGASIWGLLGSILIVNIFIPPSVIFSIGKIMVCVFVGYLVFGFLIIKYVGRAYARKVIEEYYQTSYEN